MRESKGLPTCGELNLLDVFTISGITSNISILMGPTQNSVIIINGNNFPINFQMCFNGVCSSDTTINGIMESNSAKIVATSSAVNAWNSSFLMKHMISITKIEQQSAGNINNVNTWLDQDYRSKVCPTIIDSTFTYSTMRTMLTKFPLLKAKNFTIGNCLNISAALLNKDLTLNGIIIDSYTPLFFGWAANGSDGTYAIIGVGSSNSSNCYWKQKS